MLSEIEILEQKLKEARTKEKLKQKQDEDKKVMILGRLLLKKARENPASMEEVNALVLEHGSAKEKELFGISILSEAKESPVAEEQERADLRAE